MKILSKKSYEKLQQCMTNLQMDLNDAYEQIRLYNEQVKYLRNLHSDNTTVVNNLTDLVSEKNKEIRRLKTLLTKNGISYKKEDKNGKGN